MSETPHRTDGDLTGLAPHERAARYRELADMHLKLGQGATAPEARASHLELAALWTRLAAQADRQLREEASAWPATGQTSDPAASNA